MSNTTYASQQLVTAKEYLLQSLNMLEQVRLLSLQSWSIESVSSTLNLMNKYISDMKSKLELARISANNAHSAATTEVRNL